MSKDYHLASYNWGRLIAGQGDPRVQAFYDGVDAVHAAAEKADGFIWRWDDPAMAANPVGTSPYGDHTIITLTVWRDVESLKAFVYRGLHADYFRRRDEWTVPVPEREHMVQWWVEAGTLPTLSQGMARLRLLEKKGPSPTAFTLKDSFPAPD